MKEYIVSILVLASLLISIGLLSGYKSESSSSGCSNAPEINIFNPKPDDNIENPPVSVEFEARQDTKDLTSIDLKTLSVIIRDNMNKTIDITQYIMSNCDFLKKNCTFKGDVNLEEGEYILQVKVCNTAAACETKEVRFTIFPIKPDEWRDIIADWIKRWRCNYSIWAMLSGTGCNSIDDPDKDCIRDISGCDNCPGVPNFRQRDKDGDGIGDECDIKNDSDRDGLSDEFEESIGTNPKDSDTDNDGLSDGDEFRFGGDPLNWDTNGDCVSDLKEVLSGKNCKSTGITNNNILGTGCSPELRESPMFIPEICEGKVNNEVSASGTITGNNYWILRGVITSEERSNTLSRCNIGAKIVRENIGNFTELVNICSGLNIYMRDLYNGENRLKVRRPGGGFTAKCDSISEKESWTAFFEDIEIRTENRRIELLYKENNEFGVNLLMKTNRYDSCSKEVDTCGGSISEDCDQNKSYDLWHKYEITLTGPPSCTMSTTFGEDIGDYGVLGEDLLINLEKFLKEEEFNVSGKVYPILNMVSGQVNVRFTPIRIKEPQMNKKLVYDESGKIEIDTETDIDDIKIKESIRENLKWSIDEIGDSHSSQKYVKISWANSDSDTKRGKGDNNKLLIQGLPEKNNSFGEKKVSLMIEHLGFGCIDSYLDKYNKVKIFFPKWAKNHPYPPGSQENTPNWYYYWGQEEPPMTERYYYSDVHGPAGDGLWVLRNDYKTEIRIYDGAKTSFYYCTKTMAHENQHEYDWQLVWPNGYNSYEDKDKDGLNDEWEISNCDIAVSHCNNEEDINLHWEDFKEWSQTRALEVESKYPDKSNESDWTSPGSNWR